MPEEVDHELALKAVSGCRASFGALVAGCYDRIHRLAWRFTGSAQEAEDIAQEVCLKLGKAIRSWRGDSSFETWLYRLTYTTAIDQMRSQQRFALAGAPNVIPLFEGQSHPPPDAGSELDLWSSRLIEMPISAAFGKSEIAASDDVRFSIAVAAYGQLLRGSQHTGAMTYDDVIALATGARGEDRFGLRAEFLNLVRLAKSAQP